MKFDTKTITLMSVFMMGLTIVVCWRMTAHNRKNSIDLSHSNELKSASTDQLMEKVSRKVENKNRLKREELVERVVDNSYPWVDRISAMEMLAHHDLSIKDLSNLYAYLRSSPGEKEEDFFVVCNEIMEVLRESSTDPIRYFHELLRLIEDSEADAVMRDYAIQHLTQWAEGDMNNGDGGELAVSLKSDAFQRILNVIERPENWQSDMVGTALTSLHLGLEASAVSENVIKKPLRSLVLGLASGEIETTQNNRLTAIQVATEMELDEVVEISRQILAENLESEKGISSNVQLSAVASLGVVGEVRDIELLKNYEADKSVSFAVGIAIDRIEKRASEIMGFDKLK